MPPTSPRTKPGTRKLSDLAKHLVAPADIASTGWPAVEKTCREKLGISFDDWQHGAGRLILAKREDGNLAAMIDGVGMSLPRQVGKTYLIGALVFALCVNTPGLLVIWSAHHARTHAETFLAMQGFASRSRVKAHVGQVFKGSGDEEIRFLNRSRILFGARERGFGRGIPGVDILIFDEAQILSDRALSNMLATMNTSLFGLALYIGTPPKPDDNSESFKRMRADALAGRLTDGAWLELGAERGSAIDDRKQWARANPSYPRRTPVESMMRLQRKLTAEDYLREGMGVWDEDSSGSPFSAGVWSACGTSAEPPRPDAIALAMDIDRVWLSLGAAVREPRAIGAVDPANLPSGRVRYDVDGGRMLDEAARISRELGIPVALDSKGPAESLIEKLEQRGATVLRASLDDYIQACADLYDGFEAKEVQHFDQPEMNAAAANAGWRKIGERKAWSRKGGDISMFEAGTLALWATGQTTTSSGWAVVL